jgi:hypothetical protein
MSHYLIPIQQKIISDKELNTQLVEGKSLDEYEAPSSRPATTPGGPGSQWRMMRLRRVYETAEEEGRSLEEVAIDRFGSLEAFEEAKEERRLLDERDGRKADRGRRPDRQSGQAQEQAPPSVRYMFNDVNSGASSRSSSFRRPGGPDKSSGPPTPGATSTPPVWGKKAPGPVRIPSTLGTPIPSVATPPVQATGRAMSPTSLNKLQAKALRAKLMGAPDADNLQRQYNDAFEAANSSDHGVKTRVELLPTLDGRGRLYDTGTGKNDGVPRLPGNRKPKERASWLPRPPSGILMLCLR